MLQFHTWPKNTYPHSEKIEKDQNMSLEFGRRWRNLSSHSRSLLCPYPQSPSSIAELLHLPRGGLVDPDTNLLVLLLEAGPGSRSTPAPSHRLQSRAARTLGL